MMIMMIVMTMMWVMMMRSQRYIHPAMYVSNLLYPIHFKTVPRRLCNS